MASRAPVWSVDDRQRARAPPAAKLALANPRGEMRVSLTMPSAAKATARLPTAAWDASATAARDNGGAASHRSRGYREHACADRQVPEVAAGMKDREPDGVMGHGAKPRSIDALIPLVYDELRLLAHRHRGRLRGSDQAGTTSLVHEAYLKLSRQRLLSIENRAQFFFLAAKVMRSIVVDNARRALRAKRGGQDSRADVDPDLLSTTRGEELLQIDNALQALGRHDRRGHDIVVCRFFGGLEIEETALALGCSEATVKRSWLLARIWLFRALGGDGAPP